MPASQSGAGVPGGAAMVAGAVVSWSGRDGGGTPAMRDFERTATVAANPDDAFRFLAEPSNLPRYVATMSAARAEGSERLHVAQRCRDGMRKAMPASGQTHRRGAWSGAANAQMATA